MATGAKAAIETKPEEAVRNNIQSFLNMLSAWGIEIGPEAKQFATTAALQTWNSAMFLAEVRKTKFYAKRFPGIMRPNGTMRMTEAQYISGYESSRDYAASLGRNLSREMYGAAVQKGNSPSEIRMKLEAVDKIRTYGPLYQQMSETLQAMGVVKKPPTKKELLQFALGKGDKAWYDAVRTAELATQVEGMGFDVGRPGEGGDIGYKGLAAMARELEVMGQSGDYTGLLASAEKVLGKGEWQDMGVSRKDKVALALGTRKARDVAKRVTDAVNARVAALTETRANPQLAQGPTGTQMLTGKRPVQGSE